MTVQDLLDKGYKEYTFQSDSVIAMYQKRFDDNVGIKYFITVREWGERVTRVSKNYRFDFTIQLSAKSNGNPINLNFFAGWTVNEVEAHIEDIWNTGLYQYYEEYDDYEKNND